MSGATQASNVLTYALVTPAVAQTDLEALAPYLFALMLRNVASDGFVFEDPAQPSQYSIAGAVLAAPSYPANTPGVDQDYVFNWVRDAAITALEIAAARAPMIAGGQKTERKSAADSALCRNADFNHETKTLLIHRLRLRLEMQEAQLQVARDPDRGRRLTH